jgi:hypothetical protein
VCVHLVGFQPAGLTPWQAKQLVEPVGMCAAGLAVAVVPLWQLAQLVAALNVLWSTLAPDQPLVLWHASQLVTPLCTGVLGLPTALMKAPVWQLAQLPVTVKLACTRPLAHELKLPLWQASQLAAAIAPTDA